MTTVLCVCGSQRLDSLNRRLLDDVAARLEGRCAIDRLKPQDVDLPLFNQDLEASPAILERAWNVHRRFAASDAIIVASPEYNSLPTPYLTNMVAWVSRLPHIDLRLRNPFHGQPLLLCSASTGHSGGAMAMPHARALFEYVGCRVADDAVCVPYADHAWAGSAFGFDPMFDAEIEGIVDGFIQWIDASQSQCAQPLAAR